MIRLGTRGSALALAQARLAADLLPGEVELVEITTTGDREARPLPDKEKWVRELDRALIDGEIDLAVHSRQGCARRARRGHRARGSTPA